VRSKTSLTRLAGQPRAIPVFGVTYAVSRELIGGAARARMTSNVQVRDVESTNICAETKRGEANAVVIMGSHLDGVPAGPGINDDGSGTAANLAIAIATYQELKDKTVNKIRFCWWGAEENGLLGSRAYVQMLKAENRLSAVALNINMDMVASPNYFYGIHNATSADPSVSPIAVLGSRRVQQALEGGMRAINEVYDLSPFTGRSDYGPFLEESIPAGGVETGAEERKTEAQRAKFGGLVGIAFDPCYHKACDSFFNPSRIAQLVMTQAAAGGLQSLAMQKDLRQFLTRPF
jgi:Zn-dependent M28 family amino/carboxypeptidase